jgi:hypothetical protein
MKTYQEIIVTAVWLFSIGVGVYLPVAIWQNNINEILISIYAIMVVISLNFIRINLIK